jgi:hypothetical protein
LIFVYVPFWFVFHQYIYVFQYCFFEI